MRLREPKCGILINFDKQVNGLPETVFFGDAWQMKWIRVAKTILPRCSIIWQRKVIEETEEKIVAGAAKAAEAALEV